VGNIMIDNVLAKKVNDVQNEFNRRLYHHVHLRDNSSGPPLFFRMIHDSSQDLLEFAFGHFGKNLGNLTHVLDMTHPDLVSIFDGSFSDEQKFSKQCIEFLAMAEYARNNGMSHIFPLLGNLLIKESLDKTVIKKIDGANYNKSYVRLILDSEERDAIRFCKKMQVIDLQAFYKKGEESWNAQPDCFKQFIRYDSAYMRELKQAEKKMKRYQELGCQSLASEISKSIEVFRENMEQAYYGFNRITMTSAAIILAKSMFYNYSPSCQISAGGHIMKIEAQVTVNRSFFKDIYFDSSLVVDATYHYEPKVYPFHELKDVASDEVLQTIKMLENFPEANNKPIFDHFGVIVPSIAYRNKMFKNENGILQDYAVLEDCQKEMDKMFIRNKCFYPIIVGEKDGKCFFICYWT
jgi:hypothetical protein